MKEIRATVCKATMDVYRAHLEQAGQLLDYPNPRKVTLPEMRKLEYEFSGGDGAKAGKSTVTRLFLRWCGNKDSLRWRLSHRVRSKEDGVYLSETQVKYLRQVAHSLGVHHELMFTLGTDNGLRAVDMRRLKVTDVQNLLSKGKSIIIGKGRNGGKPGLLKLNKISVPAIQEYLRLRRQLTEKYGLDFPDFWIVETGRGLHPIRFDEQRRVCMEVSKTAELFYRTHDQRRTFGHRLHAVGVPIETIAKMMRHESINTTFKTYIGIMDDEMERALEKLCPPEQLA